MSNLKNYFCAICIAMNSQSFCQEQKTYISEDKKLIYEYYENSEFERIYNGKFENQYFDNTSTKSFLRKARGQYSENKKIGQWYYYLSDESDWRNIIIEEYFGTYNNDLKNDLWTIKIKSEKKTFYDQTINITFKNDTIVGDIDFSNFKHSSISAGYKGQLDSLGRFNGIWQKKTNSNEEDIIEFYKNFVIKILKRDLETGRIYEKYLPNRELIINKIDEIYLNKINLNKCEPEYYCEGKDLFRFEETNYGYQLIWQYAHEFFPIKHRNYSDKNPEGFIYNNPKFLLIRISDYRFERFMK